MGDFIRGFIGDCLSFWLSPVKSTEQRRFEYYADQIAKKLKGK